MVNKMTIMTRQKSILWRCHPNPEQKVYILFCSKIKAGFPSPADDYIDQTLDLNEYLITHPAATFFLKVDGESMINLGIHHNDVLIVDRSIQAKSGMVVVVSIDGQFTVKQLKKINNKVFLMPANAKFSPMEITDTMELTVWGVVTNAIHSLV
jgi:DNA polymerase V